MTFVQQQLASDRGHIYLTDVKTIPHVLYISDVQFIEELAKWKARMHHKIKQECMLSRKKSEGSFPGAHPVSLLSADRVSSIFWSLLDFHATWIMHYD